MDFALIAPKSGLKATPDEYEALKVALYADDEDDEYHCFEIEYRNGKVYVSAPEGGDWRILPSPFLGLLGLLIAKNGLEYLEFGVAFADYWGVGGTYFRIRQDGSIWEPTLTWVSL